MFTYNFPEYKGLVSVPEQVTKIGFEYMEIAEEALRSNINPACVAVECLDTIHACETLLRVLQQKHGVDVQAEAEFVEKKNAKRGYYSDDMMTAKHKWEKDVIDPDVNLQSIGFVGQVGHWADDGE